MEEGRHKIIIDDVEYRITYDPYTGDWCVTSPDDSLVLQDWVYTKRGAIEFVLEMAGMIEDGNYKYAPDRT